MKKILTIICIVWACTAQAQLWFADGTRWNYSTFIVEGWGVSYTIYSGYTINGEDTIDNVIYKMMGFDRVRESNDSVFVRDNSGNDILLYNFSAVPNDTLHFPDISEFGWGFEWEWSCSKTLVLDSVALVDMYGTQRRIQYWHLDVDPEAITYANRYLHILEGVGCVYFGNPLSPSTSSTPFNLWEYIAGNCYMDVSYEDLDCFYDPVHMSVADSCTVPSASSTELPRMLVVAPNPATATTAIKWQQPLTGYLTATDLTGREVLYQPLQNATAHTLDCRAWPQGVYVLRVVGQDGHRTTAKLLITR